MGGADFVEGQARSDCGLPPLEKMYRKIAELSGCSKSAVAYELMLLCVKRAYKVRGRPKNFASGKEGYFWRQPCRISVAKLKHEHQVKVGVRCIQQNLRKNRVYRWTKMKVAPNLKKKPVPSGLQVCSICGRKAGSHLSFQTRRSLTTRLPRAIVPIGADYRRKRICLRCAILFVLVSFFGDDFVQKIGPVIGITQRKNSNAHAHVEQLDIHLLDTVAKIKHPQWVLQEDNAPIHHAKVTMDCFTAKNVDIFRIASAIPASEPRLELLEFNGESSIQDGCHFQSFSELRAKVLKVAQSWTISQWVSCSTWCWYDLFL